MKRILLSGLLGACFFFTGSVNGQPLLQYGQAAMTFFPITDNNDYVLKVFDVRGPAANATPNINWSATQRVPSGPAGNSGWNYGRMGMVFGLTIDKSGNIYVAATNIMEGSVTPMFGTAGSGGIYKVKYDDWTVTDFITTVGTSSSSSTTQIPNTGVGLGNLAYDEYNDQLFATNMEDGKIYRISMSGTIQNTFDPFQADNAQAGAADKGERLWGIGVYKEPTGNARVYFSRWNADTQDPSATVNNEIWSVALDQNGNFTGTEQREITMPLYASALGGSSYSSPVSEINFASDGRMLLAERGMYSVTQSIPHMSRVLLYTLTSGSWGTSPMIFQVGNLGWDGSGYNNCAGGVDFGYKEYDSGTGVVSGCNEMVWATGDALKLGGYNYDGTMDYVYGMAGMPATGNSLNTTAPDFAPTTSYFVDANNDISDIPKGTMGTVRVFRNCESERPEPECHPVNVITPFNADGLNDKLVFDCIDRDGWKLHIYNRWGNLIYSTSNYHNDWGDPKLSDGVYYYVADSPEETKQMAGFFHLFNKTAQ